MSDDWTLSALKEHFERIIADQQTHFEQRLLDRQKYFDQIIMDREEAVKVALEQTKEWQRASNEWRGAMTDRERNFITRNEFEQSRVSMNEKIDTLKEFRSETQGRSGGHGDTITYLVAGAAVLGFVAMVIFELLRMGKA